jgi:hypothetical protein
MALAFYSKNWSLWRLPYASKCVFLQMSGHGLWNTDGCCTFSFAQWCWSNSKQETSMEKVNPKHFKTTLSITENLLQVVFSLPSYHDIFSSCFIFESIQNWQGNFTFFRAIQLQLGINDKRMLMAELNSVFSEVLSSYRKLWRCLVEQTKAGNLREWERQWPHPPRDVVSQFHWPTAECSLGLVLWKFEYRCRSFKHFTFATPDI